MVIAVTIRANTKNVEAFFRRLPDELQIQTGVAMFNHATIIRDSLKNELLRDHPISLDRLEARERIIAEKISKFRSVVKIPNSLKKLDSMSPRFIDITKNRSLNRWARRNYGTGMVSGKSRIYLGPMGGMRGMMYVTPHPFINDSLNRVRRRLPRELRKGIRKAFRKSSTGG